MGKIDFYEIAGNLQGLALNRNEEMSRKNKLEEKSDSVDKLAFYFLH